MANVLEDCAKTMFFRAPDCLHADLEGETVMMSVLRGEYFGLNSVGSRVWALLETPQSLEQLCDVLVAEYAVDPVQCRQEVAVFLQDMLRRGILTTEPGPAAVGPTHIA